MGDHNLLHTHFHGRSNEINNFMSSQVAGRQNHVVLGNPFKTLARDLCDASIRIQRRKRRRCDSFCGELALNLRPKRKFTVGTIQPSRGLIGSIDRGHPDNLATRASGNLKCHRIQSADAVIERNRTVSLDARNGTRHNFCTLSGRDVMRLQHEPAEAVRQEVPGQIDVIRAPFDDVRGHVDLQVIATPDRLPGMIRYGYSHVGRCAHPFSIPFTCDIPESGRPR